MRRYAIVILVLLVVVGPVLVAGLVIGPALHTGQVNSLIEQYSTSPHQETADRLVKLLRRGRLPRKQGDRVFEVLMTPRVAVRTTYSSEGPIYIAIGRDSNLAFGDLCVRMDECVYSGEERLKRERMISNALEKEPRFELIGSRETADGAVVRLDRPGDYEIRLVYKYDLVELPLRTGTVLHECFFEMPITLRVVEPEQAEKVVLKSDPGLDNQIKTAFKLVRRSVGWASYSVGDDTYQYRPMLGLEAPTFPENVAFKVSYRDEAGSTIAFENFFVSQRAGTSLGLDPSSSVIPIVPLNNLGLEPGHYRGVIVLETDAELAYQDAAMKTVWDGTIELPVEFEIREAAE